ncbi:hypothetical protein P280DRAFT_91466 [Massarina eburnea CBS 473.64]|uniref:Uncharacterized protein n=1 Tax=Massarina eburnea CBS 473.64 TaxID=1395130 RepID=A0A6A6RR70_9PLEO|nr:hypothetical protein P280DRAFT_91466 [Massarina eburnea CBS 473.64]
MGNTYDLHLSNRRIVHHIRNARPTSRTTSSSSSRSRSRSSATAAAAKLLCHLRDPRVAHDIPEHIGVLHNTLRHLPHHRVLHHGPNVRHTTAAATTTTSTHQARECRQIRHTATTPSASTAAEHRCQRREVRHASRARARTTTRRTPRSVRSANISALLLVPLLRRLVPLTHDFRPAVGLHAGLVRIHSTLGVAEHIPREPQPRPRLGVIRIRRRRHLRILLCVRVLAQARESGCAVGEVNRVQGDGVEGSSVVFNSGVVIFALHSLVTQPLQPLALALVRHTLLLSRRLRGRGAGLGCRTRALCRRRGLALELLVHVVDGEQVLAAERILHGGGVLEIDFEGLGDAVGGDFELFGIFGGDGAVA